MYLKIINFTIFVLLACPDVIGVNIHVIIKRITGEDFGGFD